MGAPCFKYADLFQYHKVKVIPSNFSLYGDISSRVFEVLGTFDLNAEIYSIDEAFIHVEEAIDYLSLADEIRKKIKKWVGIPISVGIAPTKTLAKVAGDIAKKRKEGIFQMPKDCFSLLGETPVGDIWGIGKKYGELLRARGVLSALDFVSKDELWVKKHLKLFGLRTYLELKGVSCSEEEESSFSRKSLVYSRSFKEPITEKEELLKALLLFVTKALQKLRMSGGYAGYIRIFMMTNRFQKEDFYTADCGESSPERSHYTPFWHKVARRLFHQIYLPEKKYKRLGVMFTDLSEKEGVEQDFFYNPPKNGHLMQTIDAINQKFGKTMISFSYPPEKKKTVHEYTTDWDQILKIKI